MAERDARNVEIIEDYVGKEHTEIAQNISSIDNPASRIVFSPSVFRPPIEEPDPRLVSVMMPFHPSYEGVFASVKDAAPNSRLKCVSASDIWEDSTIIQDIFALIYRSSIVVCDLSERNPNAFYEAGIAHTLGKHVIPITQSEHDIPFDLRHHRYVRYLNNTEGLANLRSTLAKRFRHLTNV